MMLDSVRDEIGLPHTLGPGNARTMDTVLGWHNTCSYEIENQLWGRDGARFIRPRPGLRWVDDLHWVLTETFDWGR